MIQKQLLSEILKSEIGIWDVYEGTNVIGNRLHDKRVLLPGTNSMLCIMFQLLRLFCLIRASLLVMGTSLMIFRFKQLFFNLLILFILVVFVIL